jgi:O-succinylhomoserine sulfhydrylase
LYLTSSFIFEDAEDMRASFAEEKIETSIAVTTKYKWVCRKSGICKMGATAGFAFASGMAAVYSYSIMHYYNQTIIIVFVKW